MLTPLQERILDAHTRGDSRELERLQAEYRRSASVIRPGEVTRGALSIPDPARARGAGKQAPRNENRPWRLPVARIDGAQRFDVRLAGDVCAQIEREIADAIWRFGRVVETGGYLFSAYQPRTHDVLICHATDAGPDARHGESSLGLSTPQAVEAEFSEWTARAGLVCVGEWHTHPNTSTAPSEADKDCWASRLKRTGLVRYTGLIVTPGELGWTAPEIHAWVTRRSEALNRPVCEPALVVKGT